MNSRTIKLLFWILIILAVSTSNVSAAEYAVEVVPPLSKTVLPGEFITQVFTVINRGTKDDTYSLKASAPEGWMVISALSPITILGGAQDKVFVTMIVPRTAEAGRYQLTLTAISQADPTISDSGTCIIEVAQAAGVRVKAPLGKAAKPGETVEYTFIVINTGNVPDIFKIEAHSSRDYSVMLSQEIITLLYGESSEVIATLQIPSDARPGVDKLTLTATSTKFPQVSGEDSVLTNIFPPPPEAVIVEPLFLQLPSELNLQARMDTPLELTSLRSSLRTGGEILDLLALDLDVNFSELTTSAEVESFSFSLRGVPPGIFETSLSKSKERIETSLLGRFLEGSFSLSFLDMLQTEAWKVTLSISTTVQGLTMSGIGAMSNYLEVEDYSERLDLSWRTGDLLLKSRLFRTGPDFYGGDKDREGVIGSLSFSSRAISFLASHELSRDNVEDTRPQTATYKAVTNLASVFSLEGFPALRLEYSVEGQRSDHRYRPPTIRTRRRKTGMGLSGVLDSLSFSFSHRWERIFDGGQKDDDGDGRDDEDPVGDLNGDGCCGVCGVDDDNDGDTDEDPAGLHPGDPGYDPSDDDEDGKTDEDGPNLDAFDVTGFALGLGLSVEELYGHLGIAHEIITIADDNDDDGRVDEDPIDGFDNDHDCLGDMNRDGCRCCAGDIGVDEDGPKGPGFDDGEIKEESFRIDLGLGFRNSLVNGSLGLFMEEERAGLSLSTGLKVTEDTDISLASSASVHTLTGEVSYRATLGLNTRFALPVPFIMVKGRIEGFVFIDANGNGVFDPDKEGVPGLILSVDGIQVLTNGKGEGQYRFPPLKPGWYKLNIENLPPQLVPEISLPYPFWINAGKILEVNIPLRQVSVIEGLVFNDENKNGALDLGEEGIPKVRLALSDEEVTQETLTNPHGRFAFIDLLPGEYQVKIDETTLPARFELTTPGELSITLEPGARAYVEFGAAERPRPIIITYTPIADFSFSPEQPKAEKTILFDASDSYDPDGEIVKYEWDFNGDGVADKQGEIVEHAFSQPGEYSVTLTVTDNEGFESSVTKKVTVNP